MEGQWLNLERTWMEKSLQRFRAESKRLHAEDGGQDLVEYALVAVIIALAATAGMSSVAKQLNDVFSNVAKKIVGYSN